MNIEDALEEAEDMVKVLKMHVEKLEPLVQAYFTLGAEVDKLNAALEAFVTEPSKTNADDLWHTADQLRCNRRKLDEEMRKLVETKSEILK